MNQANT